MSDASEKKPNGAGPQPAQNLLAIFPKGLLITLTVILLALAIIALAVGIFAPGMLVNRTSRYALIVLVSLCLAVFFFVLYPEKFELTGLPGLDLGLRLVGPIALFMFLVWFLDRSFPRPSAGRVFYADRQDVPYRLVTVTPKPPRPFTYYKLTGINPDDTNLVGLYVEFDPDGSPIATSIQVDSGAPADYTFRIDEDKTIPLPAPKGRATP